MNFRAKIIVLFLLSVPKIATGESEPQDQIAILSCVKQVVSSRIFYVCQGIDINDTQKTILSDRSFKSSDVVTYRNELKDFSHFVQVLDSPDSK